MSTPSPRSKAMAIAVGRRIGFGALWLCARAICSANLLVATVGSLLLGSGLASVAMSPLTSQLGPRAEPLTGIPWWSIAAWALILAWAVFECRRGRAIFAGASWRRPMRAALLGAGFGLFFAMDRGLQFLKGLPTMCGIPIPPQPDFWPDLPPEPTLPKALGWLALCAKPWGFMARQAIPVALGSASLLISALACWFVFGPLCVAEWLIVEGWAKLKSLSSVSVADRARALGDKLAAEAEGDLAMAEAADLSRSSGPAERETKPPRL